jgi:hypothetical protein
MKNEYQLIKGERLPSGTIKHEILLPGGHPEERQYFDVRIGLTWPGNDNPAYAAIVGEAWFDKNKYASKRGEMCLIGETEYNGLSIHRFLDTLIDAYVAYCVSTIYADLEQEDYKNAFFDYCDSKKITGISIEQAPYAQDFYLGLSQIRDVDNAGNLVIPKTSAVFDEMRRIQRADLQNQPEIKFPRLNALRYIIGGFGKYPPQERIKFNSPLRYAGQHGWMM